ncbi:MAG TPA: biotin carboxylase N-terminal domain-containing protein [Actinomycetota bacterium]|nr:biotin carboxylase N-terminal domain-containing protein [Actinomycetota bacterium]
MFDKILIANRGEIAVRIARTCRERGVRCVAVHSDVDAASRHVAMAHEAVHLPGVAPTETYLDAAAVIDAAISTGAQAIHPGYGFLSESAAFAQAVEDAGLVWVGPPPAAITAVGDKIGARRIAEDAGVPVVPGITAPIADPETIAEFAREHGFPVAIKASGGGGGRGLKVARSQGEISGAFASARREAQAYFGSEEVFVERYLEAPKHLEVQLLAPSPTDALWLGVRDCSLQRRHQKLIEETPPPRFADRMGDMGKAAVALSIASGYVNAGTVEMLVDERGDFYFLEVNARLQVEHTVTEELLGIDLVACQLDIASGDALDLDQAHVEARMQGHSIECRINAEDPAAGFVPTPGTITRYVEPNGLGVRVDSGYAQGDEVPSAYDSLIAKLITWGNDREQARARMLRALDEMVVEGVATTIAAHELLLQHEAFVAGTHTTRTVEDGDILASLARDAVDATGETQDVLLVGGTTVRLWNPAMSASASAAVHGFAGTGDVTAPMQGTILKVLAEDGVEVAVGDPLMVLEAMKMETTIAASVAGRVARLAVRPGDTVAAGQTLAVIE